jgi:glycosyltransferase involved in cell wall biosynthesis
MSCNASVLVLTKNEEVDLPECLQSVCWCDDVWILDSGSADKTVQIAVSQGAQVCVRPFDGFASQRNFGLRNIPFKYEWLLILDADERPTEELRSAIHRFIDEASDQVSAGRIRRRDFYMCRWLKHAQISPYFVRLVRHAKVRYEREVNEVMIVDGDIVAVDGYLDHYPFSKGMSHWLTKHNVYSTMEAAQMRTGVEASFTTALFHPDFNLRRKHQKVFFYKMPLRPFIKFCYMFFVRRSFLDGRAGINYTMLQCIYEYMISLKEKEATENLARRNSTLTTDSASAAMARVSETSES